MSKSWFGRVSGHRFVRTTSSWVVKHTNSRTVAAWLCIDLFISLGLGAYYFFFRYVSSLGWVPLRMMNNFKFYILVAGIRATCTLWGITSVLRRDVKHVKMFYTVFLLNLIVAVWLMVPILSLDCGCTNYYQCEALQSFALDGASLNKIPQPHHFSDRKVPFAEAPMNWQDLSLGDEGESNEEHMEFESSPTTTAASTSTTTAQAAATTAPKDQQVIDDAKNRADATQQAAGPQALLQGMQPLLHEQSPNEVDMLDDLLSHGHPRLVEKKRRRSKAVSLLQVDEEVGAALQGDPVHNQLAPAELQQGLPQGVPPQGVPQQGIPLQGMPQQGVLQQNTYIPPGTAGQPPPTQMYYQQPPQGVGAPVQPLQPGTPQQFAPQMVPAQVVQQQQQPHAATTAYTGTGLQTQATVVTHTAPDITTTSSAGTTTVAVSDDKKDEKKTGEAYDINGNNFKVLMFFNRVNDGTMIKTSNAADDQESCTTETKHGEQWDNDNFQMNEMTDGKEVADRDARFMQMLGLCINSESCYGIRWKLEKAQEKEKSHERYNSTVCTLSKPASLPNKSPDELESGVRTFYLKKNEAAVKNFAQDDGRRGSLMNQILEASTPEEAVARTKDLYKQKCRCDSDSCKSYADEDGNEKSWCFLDAESESAHRCKAAGKQVLLDSKSKKKFTRDVCHAGSDYESSCRCSSIGMAPTKGGPNVNQDLLRNQFEYGSFCEKWNGDETLFKWCYVGWDSSCVDRRKDDKISGMYEEAGVPAQYWSMVACDKDVPNQRLRKAADSCENLEYTADGVCLLHLFLSIPMVAVLYNYIGNQCGDDFQTEEQFTVQSGSSSEEEEFPAGQATNKGDEDHSVEADASVPKFEGGDEASMPEAAKSG